MAVHVRRAWRLAVHRNDACALLAGGLGDELLEPGTEGGYLIRDQKGELVPTGFRGFAHEGTYPEPRVVCNRHTLGAGAGHLLRRVQEGVHVSAEEGRRH